VKRCCSKRAQSLSVALDLNREILACLTRHAGTAAELARCRMSDAASLMELADLAGAEALLLSCEEALRDDPEALATILGERGIVASLRGDFAEARSLKCASLQQLYEHSHAARACIAVAHENFGNELLRTQAELEECGAHWLAAALVFHLCGQRDACARISARLANMPENAIPTSVSELVVWVERTPKLAFGRLLNTRTERGRDLDALVAELLAAIHATTC
jgi:hypothetical protein